MATIEDRIKTILQQYLGINEELASDRSKTWEELAADAIDIVEITMACEEEFAICISDDEADSISTVGELIDLVTKKYNE